MSAESVYGAHTDFRISVDKHSDELRSFDRFATVGVSTGACSLQTYLTPNECEKLAAMLTAAAQEVRAMQGEEVAA